MIFELRQYPSLDTYESPGWISEIKRVSVGMIIREEIEVTRLLAKPKSVIQ
jgi:hypothetical protein